ncbi:MAG: hypothetical protein E3J46_06135 [Desulfobacteraceae bacterium]|nr:MAG: hypothetical protein E3J46_06135 [Desulfobacteraceae bacterium]
MSVSKTLFGEESRPWKPGDSAHLVCPGCYTHYELPEYTDDDIPTCPECGLPLLRSEQNRKRFKCFRCIHKAVVPDGIWCRQLNCAATFRMAEDCRHFVSRNKRKTKKRNR